MSTGRVAVASLAGMGPIMGPFPGSDVHVETSNFLPSFALEIPLLEVVTGPAGGGEETQSGTLSPPGDQPIAEASRTSTPTPTPPPTSRSSSTSSTSSSSSAATADTSATSDTSHHLEFIPDNKHTQEEYKGLESQNDAPESMPLIPEAKADTVGVKHLHSANMDTATTSSKTLALTTLLSVPTTVSSSSSSTSLPPPTSSPSSSLSNSTSPSVTNINEQSADPNGLLSLLRPPFRSNPNLNVKFAPLPALAPRKRKSAIPLGMAARAQLAQRRRVMYQGGYDYHGEYDDPSTRSPPPSRRHQYMTPPDISQEDEGADGSGTGKKGKKKKKGGEDAAAGQQQEQEHDDLEDMPGDPFVFLAKKMGKAGRHFWKKVAHGGGKGGEKGGVGGEENGQSENVAMVAAPASEEKEGPQSTSEKLGDGEKDAKGTPEPDAVLPEHGLSLPVTQSLPLDESPRAAEGGEGGEEMKVILKTDAADLDENLIDLSTPIPHPTVVS